MMNIEKNQEIWKSIIDEVRKETGLIGKREDEIVLRDFCRMAGCDRSNGKKLIQKLIDDGKVEFRTVGKYTYYRLTENKEQANP